MIQQVIYFFVCCVLLFGGLMPAELMARQCKCDYTVAPDILLLDGSKLSLKPGSTICFKAGRKRSLKISNFTGTPASYFRFVNYGGQVVVQSPDFHYGISIENCRYFKFSGSGDKNVKYGFKVDVANPSASGLSISQFSSDFEVEYVEVARAGFAGIMSKTDPTCDGKANRGAFVQKNSVIHDNYIHHTKGEGLYVGHSFYTGFSTQCKGKPVVLYPHELTGVKIYNNTVENSGWDGIQVGCAVLSCEIYNNRISGYGTEGVYGQMAGIQINSGTTGNCYNNLIQDGKGHGIVLLGLGNNILYNNVIINPGRSYLPQDASRQIHGIFCDDRGTIPGRYFHFINNTIVNPKTDGIRMMSKLSANNRCFNNIIINPGAYSLYEARKKGGGQEAFINVFPGVKAMLGNNFCERDLARAGFVDPQRGDFRLKAGSPAIDAGQDVSGLSIRTDFLNKGRSLGSKCDIGAFEFVK